MAADEHSSDAEGLIEALTAENKLLSRQLERQRRIRHEAEEIAEQGLLDLYHRQRELEFLSTITTMANEAGSAEHAMAAVLKYICHFIGWPAAHAHIVSGEGDEQLMAPSDIWYVDPALDLSELRTATAHRCFARGEELPGQVWESSAPVWLNDVADCANFPRRDAALQSGMRTAFSTPLLVGSDVAGTLEFFGPNPRPQDADLMNLMAKAGTQLGRLIERDRANARLTSALADSKQISALLRTKIDTMMDPQAMIETVRDSSGRIIDFVCIDANRAACRELGINREDLVGSRQLTIFPDGANSGFTALFARCIEDGKPVALDEIPYGVHLPGGLRYYDVRAVRVGSETINTTWRDVTERARISRDLARALEDSEQAHALARATSDALLDPQVLFEGVRDSGGRMVDLVYRDVNMATSRYLGLSREELIGHSCLETLPNIEGSGLLAHYIRCAETGEPVILDNFPYYNELLNDARYYDVRGAYAGSDSISLTWRDVTERVVATQRISASEERFRLLAENMGDVVAHIRDDRVAWISPSVQHVLGAPPEYWVGRDLREMVPADDQTVHLARMERISEDGQLIVPARVIAVDGTVHWIHTHAKTFHDADGNPDGFTASFRLIDDEVKAMEATEEARRRQRAADKRYRRLMDNSPIGLGIVTPDGRFEEVNQALCDFFGYDAETLRQKTWQELTVAASLEKDLEKVQEILAGRLDSYLLTKQYIHADGHLIWGSASVSCLRKPNGEVENFVTQISDITAEVEARQQVAQRVNQNRVLSQRLQAQTDRLLAELKSAASYVSSILPGDLHGPVQVSSSYLPSRELGGDCYDYGWIDDDHLMLYLIDVSGHGIEPSLVSVSVHTMLRSRSLAKATLLEPDLVLAELNTLFDMERHGDNYLTIWYGVYQASTRTLRYASAGHPPALALTVGATGVVATRLSTQAMPVGMFADTEFTCSTHPVPAGSQLLLYSDGALELPLPPAGHWSLGEFVDLCTEVASAPNWALDTLVEKLRALTVGGLFEDDCSLVRLTFD